MIPSKDTIESEARQAAQAGVALSNACPYPFTSPQGVHFIAAYLVALPRLPA